jgi:hypothetical protein
MDSGINNISSDGLLVGMWWTCNSKCRWPKSTGLYLIQCIWRWTTLIDICPGMLWTDKDCSYLVLPAWWLLRKNDFPGMSLFVPDTGHLFFPLKINHLVY